MSTMNPRPFYFSQIRIDPANDQRVYLLGFALFVSDDAGKNFREDLTEKRIPIITRSRSSPALCHLRNHRSLKKKTNLQSLKYASACCSELMAVCIKALQVERIGII